MKPIKTKNTNVIYAKDQPEYIPLPVHRTEDGMVTSCWKLAFKERLRVLFFGRIFISQLTFNNPLQPIKPFVFMPQKGQNNELD